MTTNLVNDMRYIGKKKGEFNPNYLGSGSRLKAAIRLFGKHKFTVEMLSSEDTKESLDLAEIFTIGEFDAVNSPHFYNISSGGAGGLTYSDRSLHIIPKMRRANVRYKELPILLKTHSQREIAELLGVEKSAIAQRIKAHGIVFEREASYYESLLSKQRESARLARDARKSKANKKWDEFDLLEMYKSLTQSEMSKIIGVSQASVSKKLRQLGLSKSR